jgi:hypothetical protein
MPRIITIDEKLAVIDDWLNGESRNQIAIKRILGSGTVYNIIQEWRLGIGIEKADKLRDLALKLNKTGLTVNECAIGLRMLMIFKKYGIKEDDDQEQLINFLQEIYIKCQEVEFKPQQVFDYISDILNFSSGIAISQIPQYMKKKIEQKKVIENVVQKLFKKINELSDIQMEKEQEIERLSKMEETMTKTYKTFMRLKSQLKQEGIGMDNIDQFVKCVIGISKENYNPVQILEKIADYKNLERNSRYYNEQVNLKKDELAKLNQDIDLQQKKLNYFKIKLDILEELEMMGFGIKEFRTLNNILNEIGGKNNESFDGIRKHFFDYVKNYEEVIGSRKEIDRLNNELKSLEAQTMKEREKYNAYPKILESLRRLSSAGIAEDDIVKIDKILSMTDFYLYKDNPLYKETLIDDLQKYGNLKLAIKNLENEKENIKDKKKKTQYKSMKKKKVL